MRRERGLSSGMVQRMGVEGGWPKMPAAFRALPLQRLEVRMSWNAAARISQCRLPRGSGAEQEKDE